MRMHFAKLVLLLVVLAATHTAATCRIDSRGGLSRNKVSGNVGNAWFADGRCDHGWHVVDRQIFWRYSDGQSPGLTSVFQAEDRIYAVFSTKLPLQYRAVSWHQGYWRFQFTEAGNATVAAYPIGTDAHGHTLIIQAQLPAELAEQGQHKPLHLNIEVSTSTEKHRRYEGVPYCVYPPSCSASGFKNLVACTQIKASVAHQVPEWVLYHHLQGFQHFYIYVHDELDKIQEVRQLLQPLIDDKIVTIINWNWPPHLHNFHYQQAEQNACLIRQRNRARWVALHDIDEFFQPMANGTVADWLAKHGDLEHVAALRVKHVYFGSHYNSSKQSEHTNHGNGLTTGKYVHRAGDTVLHRSKILARPGGLQYMSVHQVTTGGYSHTPDPWQELRLVHYKLPEEHSYKLLDNSMHAYSDMVLEKLRVYGYELKQVQHAHV